MSYIKQEWRSGEVITAEKLNYMENGLESISEQINDLILDSGNVFTVNVVSTEENKVFDKTWNQCYAAIRIKPVYLVWNTSGNIKAGMILNMYQESGNYYIQTSISDLNGYVTSPDAFIEIQDVQEEQIEEVS